jgi:hypothetical protein
MQSIASVYKQYNVSLFNISKYLLLPRSDISISPRDRSTLYIFGILILALKSLCVISKNDDIDSYSGGATMIIFVFSLDVTLKYDLKLASAEALSIEYFSEKKGFTQSVNSDIKFLFI